MELQYNHDQLKFKQKVRSFLKNNLSYKLSQNVKLGLELEKTDIEE